MSFHPPYTTFPYKKHDQPFPSVYDSDSDSEYSYNGMHPLQPQYRSNRLDNQIHPIIIPLLLIAFICLFAYIDAPSQPKSRPGYVWRDYRNQGLLEQQNQNTIFRSQAREGSEIPDFTEALKEVGY